MGTPNLALSGNSEAALFENSLANETTSSTPQIYIKWMSERGQRPIVPGDGKRRSPGGQPRVRGRQHGRCAEVGFGAEGGGVGPREPFKMGAPHGNTHIAHTHRHPSPCKVLIGLLPNSVRFRERGLFTPVWRGRVFSGAEIIGNRNMI